MIVPAYNEEETLALTCERLSAVCADLRRQCAIAKTEVLFVDDGSNDGSAEYLETLPSANPRIRLIRFRRNFGQTAAMAAGFDYATGSILVPIDADLQNDPRDIPAVLDKLREGYDVVSCWRKERQDPWLTRRLPSRIANGLISRISGVHLHDYGCTLKGYRREVVEHIRLYGEMHRFIPAYANSVGARIIEIPVRHHPRRFGKTKYGLTRTFKVILDLFTVKFLLSFANKPIYLFGGTGVLLMALSAAVPAKDALYDWVARNRKRWFPQPAGLCPLLPPNFASRFLP